MVTNEATGLGRRRLPAGRGKLAQVILVGHTGQSGQEVAQIGERVLAVALAGGDQRVEDGRALAGVGMPDKQPVLLADAGRSQRVLDEVIVEAAHALMQVRREGGPLGEQVIAGLAEGGLGQDPLPGVQGQPPQARHRAGQPLGFRPCPGPLSRFQLRLVPGPLPQVHFEDKAP